MKKIYLLFALMSSLITFSQIKFEKAYFINNSDVRVETLIKNVDWKNNPTSFEYRAEENSAVRTAGINDIKLFEIYGQLKYVRFKVNIDRSSFDLNKISAQSEAEFVEQTVFLKQIVEGDTKLYLFDDGDYSKFLIQKGNEEPMQLIYKKYLIGSNGVGYNRDYQSQLQKTLTCLALPEKDAKFIQYREKDLVKLVSENNKCQSPNYEIKVVTENKADFNLNIRPRVNFTSLNQINLGTQYQVTYKSQTNFGIGLEAEYIFPFNKSKWALIFEPTYGNYKADEVSSRPFNVYKASIDYQYIELPLGVRHYLFLNKNSKFFLNAQFVFNYNIKNEFTFVNTTANGGYKLKGTSGQNFAFGIGYNFKSKYAIEFKYYTNKNLLSNNLQYESSFRNASLILSYNLF